MDAKRRWLLINCLIGGAAVLGSYAWGVQARPDAGALLWGGVPAMLRPIYTLNMFLAAAGYMFFTYHIFFGLMRLNGPNGGRGAGIFPGLYAAILLPSALWLPLTFLALDQNSPALLWLVRVLLAVVAAASLGVAWALWRARPHPSTWGHRLALAGSFFFCLQTVLLDAVIWSAFIRL